MNKIKKLHDNQEYLKILIEIDKNPEVTQREMARGIGISLGKLNFCILELKKKGLIKIKNFKKSKNKIKYAYILTPNGIRKKINLVVDFMKRKMKEYDLLKVELDKSKRKKTKYN